MTATQHSTRLTSPGLKPHIRTNPLIAQVIRTIIILIKLKLDSLLKNLDDKTLCGLCLTTLRIGLCRNIRAKI
jgi:hypothetical protein